MDKVEFEAVIYAMHWWATSRKDREPRVDSVELRGIECDDAAQEQLVTFFRGHGAYKITVEKIQVA